VAVEKMVQNSILHEIGRWGGIIKNNKELRPVTQGKKTWGYTNEPDWNYGHFVGMIEGLAVLYHHVMHHRQITQKELIVNERIFLQKIIVVTHFKRLYYNVNGM
jgi:hypothetical protein